MGSETDSNRNQAAYVILAALSLDDAGDRALHEAERIASGRDNVAVHVVHVVGNADAARSDGAIASLERELAAAPSAVRERVAKTWQSSSIRSNQIVAHVRAGAPAPTIVQTATDIQADLIVVGSNRREGVTKALLGSVAEAVAHGSHCPVMVAVTKDYAGLRKSSAPEPVCTDCARARAESENKTYWCARHGRPHTHTHVYRPSDVFGSASGPQQSGFRVP